MYHLPHALRRGAHHAHAPEGFRKRINVFVLHQGLVLLREFVGLRGMKKSVQASIFARGQPQLGWALPCAELVFWTSIRGPI